ncbi:hypothetical protein [Nitrobacter sp.]|uniref:hypothetical protein n=1 Tax=Nitrobacter sp. TaxID=29420 RepID=UPI003F64E5F1
MASTILAETTLAGFSAESRKGFPWLFSGKKSETTRLEGIQALKQIKPWMHDRRRERRLRK